MNKSKIILITIVVVICGAAIFWWTANKKRIVKNAVTNLVKKKTDSLYRLTYDSSELDEVQGNVFLYNVRFRIDSNQLKILENRDSLPAATFDIAVKRLVIRGIASLDLLSNTSLEVKGIELEDPVFTLNRQKPKDSLSQPFNDTLEVYQRLTGNFDRLKAGYIRIINGRAVLNDEVKNNLVHLDGIYTGIDNVLIDSTHNYQNIVSYFIKQADINIKSVTGGEWKITNVKYQSSKQLLSFDSLGAITPTDNDFFIKQAVFTGLNTNDFVYFQRFKSRNLKINGIDIAFKNKGQKKNSKPTFRLPAFFYSLDVDSLELVNATARIDDKNGGSVRVSNGNALIRNIRLSEPVKDVAGYVANLRLDLKVGKIAIISPGVHSFEVNQLAFSSSTRRINILSLQVKPKITRTQLTRTGKQKDLYNIQINNLEVQGINTLALLKEHTIDVSAILLQMKLEVYNDKTLRMDSIRRIGKYPNHLIAKSKWKIHIPVIEVRNSSVVYSEKAQKSGLLGIVHFSAVNGVVTNVTNMKAFLSKNPVMLIKSTALFEGVGRIRSEWQFPVATTDGSFFIRGSLDKMDLKKLNPIIHALSLANIQSGTNETMSFVINGNNTSSYGEMSFNYKDLKIDLLKKNDQDSLVKKGFISFLANAAVRNNHRADKPTSYKYQRDVYKSFFNLVWKSIFEGAKNTVLIFK